MPKPDPDFDAKCADICTVYQAAPAAAKQDVHTVSIDEMTSIQALERAAPSLPMQPGHLERREFEYVRHGTQIAATGERRWVGLARWVEGVLLADVVGRGTDSAANACLFAATVWIRRQPGLPNFAQQT